MGNVAASYYGLEGIKFYSGGTTPTAFNGRTVKTLLDIGIEISAPGGEAPRGDPHTANPLYKVAWGAGEAREFSKHYADSSNPQSDFAALLVCTEADEACPMVTGASARINCPFSDPKEADGTEFETLRYSERRDEIGRFMLAVARQITAARSS